MSNCRINSRNVFATGAALRTLALRSKHRSAELPAQLPVAWCLTYGLEGCTITTIGPRNRFNVAPRKAGAFHSILYIWAAAAGIWALRGGFFVQISRCDPKCSKCSRRQHRNEPILARMSFGEGQGPQVFDEHRLALRGVLIRHLVMPGLVEETRQILRWIPDEVGAHTYVNL